MKKTIVFLATVALMAMVGNGYAIAEEYYELEKNSKGEFRAVGQKTEIRVEEKALPYESFFQEAIENSGVPVTVKAKVMPLESKLFKDTWFIQKKEIVYNDSTKLISFADNSELKEEQGPTILFGIILAAAFVMLIANGFFFCDIDKGVFASIASLVSMAMVAALFFFEQTYSNNILLGISLLLSAIVIFAGVIIESIKIYKYGNLWWYLSMLWLGYLLW